MDATDKKAVEVLCQAIVQTVQQSAVDSDIVTVVTEVNTKDNTCTVSIQGNEYEITNGTGITFKIGDRVLVHLINGNFNNKVIIAKM